MCQRIQAKTARGHPVLSMRQDNAGENEKLEKRLHSADWKLPVKIEYTAANTPQQNALVEVKFTYLASKARAAMHAAEVPRNRRLELFPEVIMTMTKLDWLKLITINKVKRPGFSALWPTSTQFYQASMYLGRSKNHQNWQRWKNQRAGSRGYVCGLHLKS
jgi:hypothetical protein